MKNNKETYPPVHRVLLSLLWVLILMTQPRAGALDTAINYQGHVTVVGNPAQVALDFKFELFDAKNGGNSLGLEDLKNVVVYNGLFSAQLDFGATAFNGQDRWLEISISQPGLNAYATLSPRQSLLAVPYALYAMTPAGPKGESGEPGAQGPIGPPGPAGPTGSSVSWQIVAGSTHQAQPNQSYLATNDQPTVITLPATPNQGDVLRLAGSGGNGWRIAQNENQVILTIHLPGNIAAVWSGHAGRRDWSSVASSADGTKLVATVAAGQIYTSTDSGMTWTPRENGRAWWSVASSADGSKLVAAVMGGQVYTSTDSGVTWVPRDVPGGQWFAVASSADGRRLVAAARGAPIHTSADSGITWTARPVSYPFWLSVACSADGTKLIVAGGSSVIQTSTDSGATWSIRETVRSWRGVASSADGTRLVAVVNAGQIYTSADSGETWTARESDRAWTAVASSADGAKLVAAVEGGQLYFSTDFGATWTPRDNSRSWSGVASSADGTRLAATVYGGAIYTSSSRSTTGVAGGLRGGQHSAVELQYIGNGEFIPLTHAGTILAY